MELRTLPESALEAATCEECGAGNVYDAPASCVSCKTLSKLLDDIQWHRDHPYAAGTEGEADRLEDRLMEYLGQHQ